MIKGIGVDIIDNDRFNILLKKYKNKIVKKILSKSEIIEFEKTKNRPAFLSKRFAAKEALSKALGCGLYRSGLYPSRISVKHDKYGKPYLSLHDTLLSLIPMGSINIQLSLSDSNNQTVAFVTIEE